MKAPMTFLRSYVLLTLPALPLFLASPLRAQDLLWEWAGPSGFKAYDDLFGAGVSFLGDVDGDGVVDALVGAPREDYPSINHPVGATRVISGATGLTLQKQVGTKNFDLFGYLVAGGGDFDGDGIADYVVGAPEYGAPGKPLCGAAYVYSGATGGTLFSFTGESGGNNFGVSVSILGDLDGDRIVEFGVGASGYSTGSSLSTVGRVYVYSGKSGTLLYVVTGQVTDQAMSEVCRLGDVNGDGVPEVGIGSYGWGAGPNGEGQFDVLDGPTGSLLYTLYGEDHGDSFGAFATGLGDLDLDGIDDFVVSAVAHTINPGSGSNNEGRVYVYSGATGTLLYHYDGVQDRESLGSVSTEGRIDINHDGYCDILIGAGGRVTSSNASGVVLAYSGRTGKLLYEFNRLDGVPIGGGLGGSLSAVGDMNGDGIDDLIAGASAKPNGTWPAAGRAYVFAGNDLFLQANVYEYLPGDPITLDVRGGEPGRVGMIVVIDVNGTSMFYPILIDRLDPDGNLQYADTATSDLSGLTVTLIGFAQKPKSKKLIDSGTETIVFK